MALDLRYAGLKNSWGVLTEDSFTQANPASPAADTANTSSRIADQTNSTGVLAGSVAFTRPDVGNNYIGGPGFSGGSAVSEAGAVVPLGLFMKDAVGYAHQNTNAIASGKLAYVCGGGVVKVDLYETVAINAGTLSDGTTVSADDSLSYSAGMLVFASENGLLTCVPEDSYEVVYGEALATASDGDVYQYPTIMGVVLQAPTASSSTLVVQLRV
tara:strand:- start:478 stop:1119 length:642 start_codon:yes stop_codon:yes gene_type:complete